MSRNANLSFVVHTKNVVFTLFLDLSLSLNNKLIVIDHIQVNAFISKYSGEVHSQVRFNFKGANKQNVEQSERKKPH